MAASRRKCTGIIALSGKGPVRVEFPARAAESAGKRPGPESSILKIKGTEIQQALSELALDALGPYTESHLAPKYFNYRKTSIYAGSNEIQKNIIAKRILKL